MLNLVLGTAQLGLDYGVANRSGQPGPDEAYAIVREAWEHGIRIFDTAQGYGNSESVLGEVVSRLGIAREVQIISKLDPSLDYRNYKALGIALRGSLERLRVESIYGFMLHREELLEEWSQGLGSTLRGFVQEGSVQYIGISVYSPMHALQALQTEGIDMVQVPTNVLDRRFIESGIFDLAKGNGKTVYVRSAFLQGLLLMAPMAIPARLSFAGPVIERLEQLAGEFNMSRAELALGYLKQEVPDAKVIFGAETVLQVKQNMECWKRIPPELLAMRVRESFPVIDDELLNPSLWPTY